MCVKSKQLRGQQQNRQQQQLRQHQQQLARQQQQRMFQCHAQKDISTLIN